jgi:hypothetical protein
MTTFDISNEADFNNSVSYIDTLGFPNDYVFDITGPITLTSQLLAINLPSGSTLTIEGTNGSGGGALANGTVFGQQPASSMAAGLLAAPSSQPTVSR